MCLGLGWIFQQYIELANNQYTQVELKGEGGLWYSLSRLASRTFCLTVPCVHNPPSTGVQVKDVPGLALGTYLFRNVVKSAFCANSTSN